MQAQLAGWERLFWLVFERSSNAIALVDDARRFVQVNDPFLALLRRSRAEIVGMSVDDNIRPSERPQAAREWDAFLRSGEYSGKRDLLRSDGSEVAIEFAGRLADVRERRLAVYVVMARGDARRVPASGESPKRALSDREREVITLIALGRETNQIAEELSISTNTVRTHVGNAMSKLGAHTRAQLVAIAICREGALHPSCLQEQDLQE